MSNSSRRRAASVSLGAFPLLLGLLAGPLLPRHARAAFVSCRSDPVVTLSNLAQIDLQADINDSTSDVQHIVYTVHVPAGTSVLSVLNTDSVVGLAEAVRVYADNPANTYDTYTTVSTGQSRVAVTATTTVVSVLGVTLGLQSVSGWNGQALHVHVGSLV